MRFAAASIVILLLASCETAVPRMSPELLAVARARDPDASGEALARGRDLYLTRCNTCHALPLPRSRREDEWPKYVASMGKKAKLALDQQDDILRYVLAARAMH